MAIFPFLYQLYCIYGKQVFWNNISELSCALICRITGTFGTHARFATQNYKVTTSGHSISCGHTRVASLWDLGSIQIVVRSFVGCSLAFMYPFEVMICAPRKLFPLQARTHWSNISWTTWLLFCSCTTISGRSLNFPEKRVVPSSRRSPNLLISFCTGAIWLFIVQLALSSRLIRVGDKTDLRLDTCGCQ